MKIVVDDKIPYIRQALEKIADEVVYLPGGAFTSELVHDADALIVRTRTLCNRELLEGSRVRFIATATIGFDHIDIAYCKEAGIVWRNAPGCNSGSVAQYIRSVLILWEQKGKDLSQLTLGVVGVGNVGKKVVAVAENMGMKVLQNDTPRADAEGDSHFVSLQQIAKECDVITFHVPLNKTGKYESYHLADDAFFKSLAKHPLIINSSRGPVVDNKALKQALAEGTVEDAVLDVWENEPGIDLDLLRRVWIGTPHIAGYSADGKANATRMSLESLCEHFGIKANFNIEAPQPENSVIEAASTEEASLFAYDPRRDSNALKKHPQDFEALRGNYPLRREDSAYHIVITSK